jgi:A/G-specific adenine glycosylase
VCECIVAVAKTNLLDFQDRLLRWFAVMGRKYPWRSTRSAYALLIAEKLLQQTAARASVVQIYQELLARFPDPQHLAAASHEELEALIRPLGFTYRARELVAMAQALVERHRGRVPNDLEGLLALPGIGDYSARAVLSFKHRHDIPIVDTNVARFLYRLLGIAGPLPSNPARKKSLIEIASKLVPSGQSREYNLAVLDLCALVCKPGVPLCPECPVRPYCATGSKRPRRLPV